MILYTIGAEQLEQFKTLARALAFPPITINEALLTINPFITTANMWFALKTHKSPLHKSFYLNETKRFAYAPAFFQLEYIERSRVVESFVNRPDMTNNMLIMFAYHLSYYIMDWVMRVMEKVDESETVEYYLEEEHFIENLVNEHEAEQQRMQRAYMQAMLFNVQQTDDLLKAIHCAIRDTHFFWSVRI